MRKTKHIDIAYHFVRERVAKQEICLAEVGTDDMVADGLTKSLGEDKHKRHMKAMGLGPIAD